MGKERKKVDINQKAIPLSGWVWKINCLGKADINFYSCEKILNYVNIGKLSFVAHCNILDLM